MDIWIVMQCEFEDQWPLMAFRSEVDAKNELARLEKEAIDVWVKKGSNQISPRDSFDVRKVELR